MNDIEVITKNLLDMNLVELDDAIFKILNNSQFISKNKRGNNMYSNSLKQFRYFVLDCCDLEEEIQSKIDDICNCDLPQTTKETIIKARIGQGEYRKQLLDKYNNSCAVTGINNKKLLVASHIKPWAVSDNHERIDVNNGILLCANMDKLFDSGLITFNNEGKMFISSFVGKENEEKLNIKSNNQYDLKITNDMKMYLEYHRDIVFVK